MKPVVILADEPLPQDDDAGFGALQTERGCLPLEALDVHARIDGLVSAVTVNQTFVNTLDAALEATYIFPLPDRAACTGFRMEVNGRFIEGELQERAKARENYDKAIEEGRHASIAEEERPGVFTLRVGNLMPGEKATIRLTLVGPLACSDGEATFRFPLVVAPRYIPGVPLDGPSVGDGVAPDTDAVPDASRITPLVLLPGFPNPVRLSLRIDVFPSSIWNGEVRSSLHAIESTEEGRVRRICVQPGERLNRDFILRLGVAEKEIKTSLLLRPDAEGTHGTFLLTLVPPRDALKQAKPRDIVFILDRSGSMDGWKMVAARRALGRMVDTLTERDRFNVLAFDNDVESYSKHLEPATDRARFRAVEFLAKIDSRGGTELAKPISDAVNVLTESDATRDRILVLVTDGQVGNEDQILKNLGKRVAGMRIFTLGIDQAVNAAFLQRLAALGGGSCELVESEDRLDEVMDKIHRRIGTPLLTDVRVEAKGLRVEKDTFVPSRPGDLFAGTPLVVMGRYVQKGSMTVSAKDAAGTKWTETLHETMTDNPALTQVWARGRVRELEDRYVVSPSEELSQQIVSLSLEHSVLCRFTAYVAVDRSEIANKQGRMDKIVQPVEMPEGWGDDELAQSADSCLMSRCAESEFFCDEEVDDEAQGPGYGRKLFNWIGRRLGGGMEDATRILMQPRAVRPQAHTGRACLVHIYPTGTGMGTRYELTDSPMVVGREEECHVHIQDESVSRRHACVQPDGDSWVVMDLQSTNGTFVNDQQVQAHKLKDGDYLHIGNHIFRYLTGGNIETAYHEEIYKLTIVDALTEIHNKRYLMEFLGREVACAVRYHKPLSLVMFDIDKFKSINDKRGHLCGDHTLRELAACVKSIVRKEDLFARYGGEEFVIVMPETTGEGALETADRVRQLVEKHVFTFDNQAVPVTISLGVASMTGDGWVTSTELVRQADEELYRAKREGRNRVCSRCTKQSVDLTPYRHRAAEMVEQLTSFRGHANFLGMLAVLLARLLEDILTVSAADEDIKGLQEVLSDVQMCLTSDAADADIMADLEMRAMTLLEGFADTVAAKKRERFWV